MKGSRFVYVILIILTTFCTFTIDIYAGGWTISSGQTLNVDTRTLNVPEGDITNNGTLKVSTGAINVGGNWVNNGTFDEGVGTVNFTGSTGQTITGTNRFFNFSSTVGGNTLTFEAGKTQTIMSTWTLTGASGKLLTLRSTASGTQWSVDPQGSRNISFVDVKDSNNINTTIINPSSSTDSGNTTNWFDPVSEPTLTAAFTSDKTSGTAPLTVQFTDNSTGTVIDTWSWDFGDGSTKSTLQSPSHTFNSDGSFTVTLTITGSGKSSQASSIITVQPVTTELVAAFTSDKTSGEVPLTVKFTDQSTGTIDSWSWSFGDGNTSTDQNPSNTYTKEGVFTVALTVTGSGNSDNETKTGFINIGPIPIVLAPIAEFSADKLVGIIPFEVQFTDESKNNPTSWVWDFGDGDKSSDQNPKHTYEDVGDFDVELIVSNSKAKSTEKKEDYITTKPITDVCEATFVAKPLSGIAPLNVQFTDLTPGELLSWTWDFGDGNKSSEQNPMHEYQEGEFVPTLIVTTDCGEGPVQLSVIGDPISVLGQDDPPIANFTANPQSGLAELGVQFTNISSGGQATSFAWSFGDGVTSKEEHPLHTYKNPGKFTPSLFVSNAAGKDLETKSELIDILDDDEPVAAFEASPQAGFAPFAVLFTDTSTGSVDNWSWEFGDSEKSILKNPLHVYENPGEYSVTLTVSSTNGKDTEEKKELIEVKTPSGPVSAFTAEPLIGFNPLTVTFTDRSSGDVSNWIWDFGDGETSTLKNPIHKYTKSGSFDVELKVSGKDGISETEEKNNFIEIFSGEGVSSNFTADQRTRPEEDSGSRFEVQFSDLSSSSTGQIDNWEWNFGDGDTSSQKNPEHEYSCIRDDDTFAVSLTVVDSDNNIDTLTDSAFISCEKVESTPEETTPIVTPTPDGSFTPTPTVIAVAELTVDPDEANKSLGFIGADVTALDEEGNPVEGAKVSAEAFGRTAFVNPSEATTDSNGQATFGFRFGFLTSNGEIRFCAENENGNEICTKIEQQ